MDCLQCSEIQIYMNSELKTFQNIFPRSNIKKSENCELQPPMQKEKVEIKEQEGTESSHRRKDINKNASQTSLNSLGQYNLSFQSIKNKKIKKKLVKSKQKIGQIPSQLPIKPRIQPFLIKVKQRNFPKLERIVKVKDENNNGELTFTVKFQGKQQEIVKHELLRQFYKQQLINYYEQRITWQ